MDIYKEIIKTTLPKREVKYRMWRDGRMQTVLTMYADNNNQFACFTEEEMLMQYTGLKDKNGKEIYEGDIMELPLYGNSIVMWNEDICSFQYAYQAIGKGTSIGERMTNTLYSHDAEIKYKIIGNIYENPELFKT